LLCNLPLPLFWISNATKVTKILSTLTVRHACAY
jgi:hypothetical protein